MTGDGSLAAQMFTSVSKEIPAGSTDFKFLSDVMKSNGVNVTSSSLMANQLGMMILG
jgi:hypothetical protein